MDNHQATLMFSHITLKNLKKICTNFNLNTPMIFGHRGEVEVQEGGLRVCRRESRSMKEDGKVIYIHIIINKDSKI